MTYEEALTLCEKYGYNLDCWSPLEISDQNGGQATGQIAQDILDMMVRKEKRDSKREEKK